MTCLWCDDDLRGTRIDRVCPEFGLSIGPSLRADQLRVASPEWLGAYAAVLVVSLLLQALSLTSLAERTRDPRLRAAVRVVAWLFPATAAITIGLVSLAPRARSLLSARCVLGAILVPKIALGLHVALSADILRRVGPRVEHAE
ncbi:MAG: hypothetical protein L6Q92_12815 [Phycisphaerae bacterium]|nr:hypothetical protein [Phycisphaerae bacterium]